MLKTKDFVGPVDCAIALAAIPSSAAAARVPDLLQNISSFLKSSPISERAFAKPPGYFSEIIPPFGGFERFFVNRAARSLHAPQAVVVNY
jgi:hypothetical protein